MTRRLLATRRLIPLDRLEDYHAGWQALESAARAAGARAWMFRRVDHQDQFIEFLEWQDGGSTSLLDVQAVAAARHDLDAAFGSGHADEWEEVQTP
jgi:hypothetical protein